MRIDWSTLALQLINFAVLVWLLQRFLYRPVLRLIDARRTAIDEQYAAAGRAGEKAKEQLADLKRQRAGIAAERAAALKGAAEEAQRQLAACRVEAEHDAEVLMTETRRTLAQERARALEEVRRAALTLAADLAGRVLAEVPESLRTQAWLERIARQLESHSPAERTALADGLSGSAALRIVTAVPLSAQETTRWRERLGRAIGRDVATSFVSDPQLIGGAELHFPHATLSFSIRGAMASLEDAALTGEDASQAAMARNAAAHRGPSQDGSHCRPGAALGHAP